jgi:hypothetical protein
MPPWDGSAPGSNARQDHARPGSKPRAVANIARSLSALSARWPDLGRSSEIRPEPGHLLRAVSKESPVTQEDLQKKLGLDWMQLRGVHNGLARICEGLGIEKPVRTSGYNAENRTYEMSIDVATTIRKIPPKRKP